MYNIKKLKITKIYPPNKKKWLAKFIYNTGNKYYHIDFQIIIIEIFDLIEVFEGGALPLASFTCFLPYPRKHLAHGIY